MTTANDMRQRIRAEPFQPFRVYLTDGRHFDVHRPSWTLVGEPVILIGVPSEEEPRLSVPDYHEMISYQLIDRVEPLSSATVAK